MKMRILFAADKFDDERRDSISLFPGGAELTDAAIIEASPFELHKGKFAELKTSDIKDFDFIIIGNSKTASNDQLDYIAKEKDYLLFEHDMRICRYDGDYLRARKEPVHFFLKRCICPHINLRKLYGNAAAVIFLTHKQFEVYKRNPFFKVKRKEFIGSSVFSRSFFDRVKKIRKKK